MNYRYSLRLAASFAAFSFTSALSAQITVWSEDFTGFTAGTDYFTAVGVYTFGFDGDGDATFDSNTGGGNNVKPLSAGEWGRAGDGSSAFGFNDIGGGNIALQPALSAGSSRGAGVFLDASLFTLGSGTYTLTFDIIGDSGPERNARAWIGTSSTHDNTIANGWGVDVADVNPSDGSLGSPWLTSGSAVVNSTVSSNLVTASSSTFSMEFNYTAGEDVGIMLAAVNSGVAFDNFQITSPAVVPEPSTYALLAGMSVLGLVLYRRRRA